jgi:hypothetical protein
MPPERGRSLAKILLQGRLIEIADSYTLIPEDQPVKLAGTIRDFVRDTPGLRPYGAADKQQPIRQGGRSLWLSL